jgi:hypothetical protein
MMDSYGIVVVTQGCGRLVWGVLRPSMNRRLRPVRPDSSSSSPRHDCLVGPGRAAGNI